MKVDRLQCLDHANTITPYILEGGFASLDPSWRLRRYSAPYSRLYYLTGGEAYVESARRKTVMVPGNLYLIPPRLTFDAGCPARAQKIYFHLNLLKKDGYDLCMELQEVASLPVSEKRLCALEALCREQNFLAGLQLKTFLQEDLVSIFSREGIGAGLEVEYSPPVRETVAYIRQHLSVQLSVKSLAARLYLSESTLAQCFRRELGKTVGLYIDEMVFFEAQRQLLLTDRPVRQISDDLGFCDQFYFSRRFRLWSGKTPTAYRREGKFGERFCKKKRVE